MRRAMVISRFDLSAAELVRAGAMFQNYAALVSQCTGFVSTSVWRGTAHADRFMRLTLFESISAYLAGYDWMVESGGLETAVTRYGVLPDVQLFEVAWTHGRKLEKALDDEYVSLSDRALDTAEDASAWVDKLKMNLRECDAIPGFDGCLIGLGYHLPEQVAGVALWRSETAYRESVPNQPDYPLALMQRVR